MRTHWILGRIREERTKTTIAPPNPALWATKHTYAQIGARPDVEEPKAHQFPTNPRRTPAGN